MIARVALLALALGAAAAGQRAVAEVDAYDGRPAAAAPSAPSVPPPQAADAHPSSVCPDMSSQPQRRRPGEPLPARLQPPPCDPDRLPTPKTASLPPPQPANRWKVVESVGVPDNYLNPYTGNNPIKGDRPLVADAYTSFTATSTTLIEARQVPAAVAPGGVGLVGRDQLFESETLTLDEVLYQGDTVFKPPDFQMRFTPIFNYNVTRTAGSPGQVSSTTFGAQALFFEAHLRDVSANYDFDSMRVGVQGMISDFRGFVLSDQPVGLRFFGTRDNDIYQYSLGWFRTLPKNADRQNELGMGLAPNDIVMGNLLIEDLGVAGLNTELTAIYDRNRATGTRIVPADGVDEGDGEGGPGPATFEDNAPHDFDVGYLGYSTDGHIGILNITSSIYEVLGRERQTLLGVDNSKVEATFAGAELSRDFDWVRVRLTGLYASGDSHPYGSTSHGFDGISESALTAGADSSFFLHQQLELISGQLDLKERDSIYPDLRGTAANGVPNFKNPGLRLVGLGSDLDLAPQLRVSVDVNHIWLDQTQMLDVVLGRVDVPRDIGTEGEVDVIYRPLDSQNIILRISGADLLAGAGGQLLAGGRNPFSTFATLTLAY